VTTALNLESEGNCSIDGRLSAIAGLSSSPYPQWKASGPLVRDESKQFQQRSSPMFLRSPPRAHKILSAGMGRSSISSRCSPHHFFLLKNQVEWLFVSSIGTCGLTARFEGPFQGSFAFSCGAILAQGIKPSPRVLKSQRRRETPPNFDSSAPLTATRHAAQRTVQAQKSLHQESRCYHSSNEGRPNRRLSFASSKFTEL
jgi:hypothetical protein